MLSLFNLLISITYEILIFSNIFRLSKIEIFLTIDDGPSQTSTKIIEYFVNKNIPAVFFYIGDKYKRCKGKDHIVNLILASSDIVAIGNHSYCHAKEKYKEFYKDSNLVVDDLRRAEAILPQSRLFTRLPGRNVWILPEINLNNQKYSQIHSLYNPNSSFFGWDCEWSPDFKCSNIYSKRFLLKILIKRVFKKNKIKNKFVVLLHEKTFKSDIGFLALDEFIRLCHKGNFVFKRLDDLVK